MDYASKNPFLNERNVTILVFNPERIEVLTGPSQGRIPFLIFATGALIFVCICAGIGRPNAGNPESVLAIDPNTAPLPLLATLPRVGQALVKQIETSRQSQPIRSEADLDQIKGIGARTLTDLRPYLTYPLRSSTDDPSLLQVSVQAEP